MRKWGCHLGHPDWPHHRVGDDPVCHAVLIAGDPVRRREFTRVLQLAEPVPRGAGPP